MQILIQLTDGEIVSDVLDKVKQKIQEGKISNEHDPQFRVVATGYEELPMSEEDIKEYNKQKFLEHMYKIMPKDDLLW